MEKSLLNCQNIKFSLFFCENGKQVFKAKKLWPCTAIELE